MNGTTKRPKAPTPEEVRALAEAGWASWCATRGSQEQIRDRVYRKLDAGVEEVVAKVLGFTNHWASQGWEVDHCNGRSGNSIVGDYIRKTAHTAVVDWMAKQLGDLPKLPKDAVAAMKKEYIETYRSELRRRVRELATSAAEKRAQEMIEQAMAPSAPMPSPAEEKTK